MNMKRKRDWILVSLVIGIILLGGLSVGVYFFYFNNSLCHDFECFEKNMERCSRAEYINEEPEASWYYKVNGFGGEGCEINVRLIQAKKGELGIDELEGLEMTCEYGKGIVAYPEKDLNKCHGRLKEEMQEIVIKKLHSYLLENLGPIEEELETVL
tara:strand:- start:14530 stop:14997 length:468 start_codon:yes stop_codon:yes gene_type:complete